MNEQVATISVTTGPPRWMMSFADLMSVILTFFVLLFSLSVPPTSRMNKKNDLIGNSEAPYSVKHSTMQNKIKAAQTDQDLSTNYLADIIKNRMSSYPGLSKAILEATDDKLILSINANEFNDEYAANMAGVIKSLSNRVALYSSTLDQSKAVMEKLRQKGLDRNISFFESHDIPGKIDIVIYP